MKKWIKITLGLLLTLVIFITGAVFISYRALLGPIPVYDGVIDADGLTSPVEIYRDSFAVPYISAQNEIDAAFALGFVHAQERMFQMDITRRAGEGRLSEILGNKVLPFDKMFRTIGLMRVVEKHYPEMSGVTKEQLSAYSNGVNAYLNSRDSYSIEFDLLGYTPYGWKPVHSLLVAKLMAWELNISWWTDITFSHLVQRFGAEKAAEILPGFDENAPTIIPKGLANADKILFDLVATDKQFRDFIGMHGTHIGSNNWVVNAEKSASGKAIIANDPHLAFSVPGKWLVASVKGGNWKAQGFTLPGVPAIVIGRNDNISWVLTNVMTDDADFYIEKFDSSKTKYFFNGRWNNLEIVKDTIHVKDSSDAVIQIKSTHRGPVISGIHPYQKLFPDTIQTKADISMRWTALEFSDEFFGIYGVNNSNNWNEFEESVQYFTVPGQNFVYGDREGNIGYICAAKLPKRNFNSPTLVYDGTTDNYDWQGYVPYNQMPKLFNPSKNYIASANNKTVSEFKYHISNIWEPSSRIFRITEILEMKDKLSVSDFKSIQMDFQSHYAVTIVKRLLEAFKNTTVNEKNLKTALQLMNEWDFVMNKYSQAPSIYLVYVQNLLKNIFMDEMGENLFKEYVFIANVPYRMIEEICNGKYVTWIDNINTEKKESFNEIIRQSFIDALIELEDRFGNDMADWQWRNIHTVTFNHLFSGQSDIIDNIVNIGPYPISGDGTTVFNTEYSFTDPYKVKLGPSMRYIYNFANNDYLYYILPTGQSGHIMSDHYSDMTKAWINGGYNKLYFNSDKIASISKHVLILK